MSAGCYLCEMNYAALTGRNIGDAVGACNLCGVLACLAHGMRDANRPAYVCGCCVPNLLAAAAVRLLDPVEMDPQTSPGDLQQLPDTPSRFSQWALDIDKVDDVIGDLADDRWAWIQQDMEYLLKLLVSPEAPAALRAFARPGADQARDLITAAAAIATKLNLPSHEMSPVLRQVAQGVRRYA